MLTHVQDRGEGLSEETTDDRILIRKGEGCEGRGVKGRGGEVDWV